MSKYEVHAEPTNLVIKTRRPEKWLLVDRETGQVYQGNKGGWWDKMYVYKKEQDEI